MSATLSAIVQPSWTRRLGPGLRIVNAVWEGIARYVVHRAAIAGLHQLDDRALQDIGLTRSQIEAAVRGFIPARRRTAM